MSTAKAFLIVPGYMASWPQPDQPTEPMQHASGIMPHPLHPLGQWEHEAVQQPWQSQLCQLLGCRGQQDNRLPTFAAVEPSVNRSGAIDDRSIWVHADPVHLKADRDTATLIPPELLNIDDDSADTLINTLNDFYASDGIRFHRQAADCWFISGRPALSLAAYPTSFLAHRNASAFLPDEDSAGTWRRFMTEIQMLLHAHPLNEERERNGLMTINSLWFWGGVPVAEFPVQERPIRVFADEPYAVALCKHLQVERFPLNAATQADGLLPHSEEAFKDCIVVDTRLIETLLRSDTEAMNRLTQQISDTLVQPLASMVEKGSLGELHVQTEDGLLGHFSRDAMKSLKKPTGLRRWWKHLSGKWK